MRELKLFFAEKSELKMIGEEDSKERRGRDVASI